MRAQIFDSGTAVPPVEPDPVEPASRESFPASDPPAWIGAAAGTSSRVAGCRAAKRGKVLAFKPKLARRTDAPTRVLDSLSVPVPNPANGAPVRIYRPSASPLQGGRTRPVWVVEFEPQQPSDIEPLMGWTSSHDPLQQVRLTFPSREQAMAFAERQGWPYTVSEPHARKVRSRPYADNFRRPWEAAV